MYDATVRDAAVRERLAQSLADYYYRRTLGIVCFDPRQPSARAEYDEMHRRKLALARHTLNKLLAARPADAGRRSGANILRWHGRTASAAAVEKEPEPSLAMRSRAAGRAQALASSTSSMATGLPL